MADLHVDDISESVRNLVLAGIGAVATGAEQGQKVVEELVRKGEGIVQHSKVANAELTRNAQDAASQALHDAGETAQKTAQEAVSGAKGVIDDVMDAALKARLSLMSDEDREQYVQRVSELSEQIVREREERKAQEEAERKAQDAAADTTSSTASDTTSSNTDTD